MACSHHVRQSSSPPLVRRGAHLDGVHALEVIDELGLCAAEGQAANAAGAALPHPPSPSPPHARLAALRPHLLRGSSP